MGHLLHHDIKLSRIVTSTLIRLARSSRVPRRLRQIYPSHAHSADPSENARSHHEFPLVLLVPETLLLI
jgi:hypothetical protein